MVRGANKGVEVVQGNGLGNDQVSSVYNSLSRGLTLMRRRACKWKLLRRIEQIALWEITLPPTISLPFIYLPNHLDRDTGQMLLPAVPSWEGSF